MTKIDDFFDKAVRHIGGRLGEKFVINIGAMDGILYDEMSAYTAAFGYKGLYVEPIPYLFEKLKKNFPTPGNLFENSAISDYNGEIRMLMIDEEAIKTGKVHECFYGMSAVYPPKNGLASDGDKHTVEKYGKQILVPCITFDSLIEKHNIKHFDVLKIDAEGHDWTIFRTIDLDKYKPSVIRLEWLNLSDQEKIEVTDKFIKHNYLFEVKYGDITAISEEIYNSLSGEVKETPKQMVIPEPTENLLFTSVSKVTTIIQSKLKYSVSFEVVTDKDVANSLLQTFGEVSKLHIEQLFQTLPIQFIDGNCKVNDFLIEVSTDGITITFDANESSRENGSVYRSGKPLSSLEIPKVIQWLETMDSDEVYTLAKLTFKKV